LQKAGATPRTVGHELILSAPKNKYWTLYDIFVGGEFTEAANSNLARKAAKYIVMFKKFVLV
jgi:hypothetical protein